MRTKTNAATTDGTRPAETTLDDFLGGRVSVMQPAKGHRAGSDAIWLQAAVRTNSGRVLDAGAGVGVAGLCLAARRELIRVTAVEIDQGLCALADENAAGNGLSQRFQVINADVTERAETLFSKGLLREGYQEVMANPPYYRAGRVRPAPDAGRAAAHVIEPGGLAAWIKFLATMTAPKGWLTLIHRPDALPELLPLLQGRFGAVTLYPLFPKENEPATRLIIQGQKGSKAELRLLPGLVLHQAGGRYTAAAEAVLREGAPLDL